MDLTNRTQRLPRLSRLWVGLCTVCLLAAAAPEARSATTSLIRSSYQEALEEARVQDLPVVLHFYTDWCGPCQQMDRTVFAAPQLEKSLAGKILLVKVNADQHPDVASLYRVSSYPTDVYVDPQGRVLTTSIGMASLSEYVSNALQVEGRYRKSRTLVQARQESGNSPSPAASLKVTLGQPGPFPAELFERSGAQRESQAGQPGKPESGNSSVEQNQPPTSIPVDPQERQPEVIFVALDGYCPVRLKESRQWIPGEKNISSEYQQQRYLFASPQEREEFDKQPEKYAPRLLGCDAVIMWESDRALPGSTEFAAYYKNELYLFTSEQNREIFRVDPQRYITLKHVLAPRDVEATLIR